MYSANNPLLYQIVLASFVAWILWTCSAWVYNLYFHPLARFPGPRLAAMTDWWKAYIVGCTKDSLVMKLVDLHVLYGDVIRIGPNELHFSQPSAYNEIFNPTRRWDKNEQLYKAFAEGNSSFTLLHYPEAKKRRDLLLPLFSRRAIVNMQQLIQDNINALCLGFEKQYKAGQSANIYLALRCLALDTIMSFCFAESMHTIDEPGFESHIVKSMGAALPIINVFIHFPLLRWLMQKCPPLYLVAFNPTFKGYVELRTRIRQQLEGVLKNPQVLADAPHPIIYHELLDDSKCRDIPSVTDLNDEAWLLAFAGTDNTTNAWTWGTIHALDNPNIHQKLQAELREAWPKLEDVPRYEALEKLPYLRAVIKESLRLSFGVIAPLSRQVPSEGAQISAQYIPGGTTVSMSAYFSHMNEEIFPEPHAFKPERWLELSSDSLETYLVAFSKGPRSCLGINLAHCELYLGFANLFRRFEMKLDGVSPSDLQWQECFMPHFSGPPLKVFAKPCTD